MAELSYGVQRTVREPPRALLDQSEAAAYLGVESPQVYELLRARKLRRINPPSIRLYQHFWVRDLDRHLEEEGREFWIPWSRYSRDKRMYTWQAAMYLHINESQVRKLARQGHLAATGGGQGVGYEFLVGDLDDAIDGWGQYW